MTRIAKATCLAGAVLALAVLGATPTWGQGHEGQKGQKGQQGQGHENKGGVTVEVALGATRDVLVAKGFEVIRVEIQGDRRIVYYRAGNQGRGRGQGPPQRLVIRRAEDKLVVDEAPEGVRLEIGVKLGIKL
jgi:hypothetical protein